MDGSAKLPTMIARLWVCSDQPLAIHALALPLHPLFILLAVALMAWWMLTGRVHAARIVLRLVGLCSVVLVALTLLFAALAFSLLSSGLDPSAVLQFAPLAWALGGVSVLAYVAVHVWKRGARAVLDQLGIPEFHTGMRAGCVWWFV